MIACGFADSFAVLSSFHNRYSQIITIASRAADYCSCFPAPVYIAPIVKDIGKEIGTFTSLKHKSRRCRKINLSNCYFIVGGAFLDRHILDFGDYSFSVVVLTRHVVIQHRPLIVLALKS